jgi:ornithine cyclodeaminase/alanine dehydrogenase-like protein (mu-crystallin family)
VAPAPVLVLGQRDVRRLLDVDALIDALVPGFVALSDGRVSVPPRVAAEAGDAGVLLDMPAYAAGVLGTKLVSLFAGNATSGLPAVQAVIVLFDADNGAPLAILDGTIITAARTAAATALATRLLARDDAAVLAVLGSGVQARAHLDAIPRVRSIGEIRIASRTYAHAAALADEVGAKAVGSFEEAVRDADVVCACTDSPSPVVDRAWLARGAHVNSVGVSRGGPELDDATVRAGLLVVESRAALEPFPAGAHELAGLEPEMLAELGEIITRRHPGRRSPDDITVYKSVGHAMEDAVAAGLVYRRARAEGVGTEIDLAAGAG